MTTDDYLRAYVARTYPALHRRVEASHLTPTRADEVAP